MVKYCLFSFFLTHVFSILHAETVKITVGDTGCPARQQAVKLRWEKIPNVTTVIVLPKQRADPAASRTFVLISSGPSPDPYILKTALGRRAERYPILAYKPVE